jgi:hypothetical protein
VLDTGAGGLLVRKGIAEKAGIKPIAEAKIGGIGDSKDMEGYVGYADSIRVGDFEFHNCLVTVTQKTFMNGEDGLIGADVFSDYLVRIDFPNQKLKLEPLPKRPDEAVASAELNTGGNDTEDDENSTDPKKPGPRGPQDRYIAPEMKDYIRAYRFGHDLLIPTRIGDSEPKLFLIDSGAMTNAISPAAAREVTHVHVEPGIQIKGMSGQVNRVFTADKAVLEFGHYRQPNQDLISWNFSNLSKSLGTEVSGFLGFTTMRMFELKIDYRDGLVDFEFNKEMFGK